jgi:hypothetical protein
VMRRPHSAVRESSSIASPGLFAQSDSSEAKAVNTSMNDFPSMLSPMRWCSQLPTPVFFPPHAPVLVLAATVLFSLP